MKLPIALAALFLAATTAGFNLFTIGGIVCCSLLFIATLIVSGLVKIFTTDFASSPWST